MKDRTTGHEEDKHCRLPYRQPGGARSSALAHRFQRTRAIQEVEKGETEIHGWFHYETACLRFDLTTLSSYRATVGITIPC